MSFNATPEQLADKVNNTEILFSDVSTDVVDVFVSAASGSVYMAGAFTVFMFSYVLWRANVSTDVAVAIMLPLGMFMGKYGLLPGSKGIVVGLLFAAAGITSFGLMKFLGR